jgi:hypothetical protein
MYFTAPGPLNLAEADVRQRMVKAAGLAQDGERGASAIEWVIISAVLILIAGGVGTIIYLKIKTAAEAVILTPPNLAP